MTKILHIRCVESLVNNSLLLENILEMNRHAFGVLGIGRSEWTTSQHYLWLCRQFTIRTLLRVLFHSVCPTEKRQQTLQLIHDGKSTSQNECGAISFALRVCSVHFLPKTPHINAWMSRNGKSTSNTLAHRLKIDDKDYAGNGLNKPKASERTKNAHAIHIWGKSE